MDVHNSEISFHCVCMTELVKHVGVASENTRKHRMFTFQSPLIRCCNVWGPEINLICENWASNWKLKELVSQHTLLYFTFSHT